MSGFIYEFKLCFLYLCYHLWVKKTALFKVQKKHVSYNVSVHREGRPSLSVCDQMPPCTPRCVLLPTQFCDQPPVCLPQRAFGPWLWVWCLQHLVDTQ